MNDEKEQANATSATSAPNAETERKREVLVRFTRAELDEMKRETGAEADASAVAAFVRKNLRKRA